MTRRAPTAPWVAGPASAEAAPTVVSRRAIPSLVAPAATGQAPAARAARWPASSRWRPTAGPTTPPRTPSGAGRHGTRRCSARLGICTCTSPTACTTAPTSCAGPEGEAGAVLLRALAPLERARGDGGAAVRAAGAGQARRLGRGRRATVRADGVPEDLCSGPAKLCQAFALDRAADGYDLISGQRGRRPARRRDAAAGRAVGRGEDRARQELRGPRRALAMVGARRAERVGTPAEPLAWLVQRDPGEISGSSCQQHGGFERAPSSNFRSLTWEFIVLPSRAAQNGVDLCLSDLQAGLRPASWDGDVRRRPKRATHGARWHLLPRGSVPRRRSLTTE